MIRLACLALALSASSAFAQTQVARADFTELEQELNTRLDFEQFETRPEPGVSVEGLIEQDGIAIGETLQGMKVIHVPHKDVPGSLFDAFAGQPTSVLPKPGRDNQNFAVTYHKGLESNALFAVGPRGFPKVSALGEGTLAVKFDNDQSAFGFRLHADYEDPLGVRPAPGHAFLMIWNRDAKLIGFEIIALRHGVMDLGWRTKDNGSAIAGFTLAPDDPGGYAIDDILYALPVPLS